MPTKTTTLTAYLLETNCTGWAGNAGSGWRPAVDGTLLASDARGWHHSLFGSREEAEEFARQFVEPEFGDQNETAEWRVREHVTEIRVELESNVGPRVGVDGNLVGYPGHASPEEVEACLPEGWEVSWSDGVKTRTGGWSYPIGCDAACREAVRAYLASAGSTADVVEASARCDWSEVHLALEESGEEHLWAGLRKKVLEIHPGADI